MTEEAKTDDAKAAAVSRRTLLRCGLAAACSPLLSQLGCAPRLPIPLTIAVDAPVKNVVRVEVSRVPELAQRGGALLLRSSAPDWLGRPTTLLVVNTEAQGLRAYDAYCPHAGCAVAWDDASGEVVCPCHLSRFSVDGAVINPPAQSDLDTYPVKLRRGDVPVYLIDLNGSGGLFPAAQGGVVAFKAADVPALATAGGSATGRAGGVPFPLLVMRLDDTVIAAYDARCPHLGCAVQGKVGVILCPCHGSVFALDGSVQTGPATGSLTPLPVDFDGETIRVTVA